MIIWSEVETSASRRQRHALRVVGAGRPRERGREHQEDAPQRGVAGTVAGQNEDRQADEADRHPDERGRRRPVALTQPEEDHDQRHRADQEGGQPGGHLLLGHRHEAVAAEAEQDAGQRRRSRPRHA